MHKKKIICKKGKLSKVAVTVNQKSDKKVFVQTQPKSSYNSTETTNRVVSVLLPNRGNSYQFATL